MLHPKYLTFYLSLSLFVSCDSNSYHIHAILQGIPNGEEVSIMYLADDNSFKTLSVAKVENEQVQFEGTAHEPKIAYLKINGIKENIDLIIEAGKINMYVFKDSIFKSTVTGTKNNAYMNEYKDAIDKYNTQIELTKIRFQESSNELKNQERLNLNRVLKENKKNITKYNFDFISSHRDSFISLILLNLMSNQPTTQLEELKSHFKKLSENLKNTQYSKQHLKHLF